MLKESRFAGLSLGHGLGAAFTLGLSALVSGCALESAEESVGDEVQVATEAIRNGTITQKRGVVQLEFSGNSCTGAMIGPRYIITAAHCFRNVLGGAKSANIQMTVGYFDPKLAAGTKRAVTATNETVRVWVKETYAGKGDYESDIALVRRTGAIRWNSTSTNDYLNLSLGSCTNIDRNNFYGSGYSAFSGDGLGTLRTMPINIHACKKHYFYDLAGARQVCKGDSGGPYISSVTQGGFQRDVVVGLLAWMETHELGGTSAERCAEGGEKQIALRMNTDKVSWVESKLSAFSDVCYSHTGTNGHKFKRCWEVLSVE